jgi:hypothetical protein
VQGFSKVGTAETLASYSDGVDSSPFAMSLATGGPDIVYLNVFPMIAASNSYYPELLNASSDILLPFVTKQSLDYSSPWFSGAPSLLFTSFDASGSISVDSTSMALSALAIRSGIIEENGANYDITVGPTLPLEGYTSVQIVASEVDYLGGNGFYSELSISNPTIVFQADESRSLRIGDMLFNDSSVELSLSGNSTIFVRAPSFMVSGNVSFDGFYMLHSSSEFYTDGRETTLSGNLTFGIYVASDSSVALPYEFGPSVGVAYSTPLVDLQETNQYLLVLPWVLFLVVVIVLVRLVEVGGS